MNIVFLLRLALADMPNPYACEPFQYVSLAVEFSGQDGVKVEQVS